MPDWRTDRVAQKLFERAKVYERLAKACKDAAYRRQYRLLRPGAKKRVDDAYSRFCLDVGCSDPVEDRKIRAMFIGMGLSDPAIVMQFGAHALGAETRALGLDPEGGSDASA